MSLIDCKKNLEELHEQMIGKLYDAIKIIDEKNETIQKLSARNDAVTSVAKEVIHENRLLKKEIHDLTVDKK